MKNVLFVGLVCLMISCAGLVHMVVAKGKSIVDAEITEVQKQQQQLNALKRRRQQYLDAVQKLSIEIIKVQAVLDYVTAAAAATTEKTTTTK